MGTKNGPMSINATTFHEEDTLVITLKRPHAGQLAIKAPGKRYYFLAADTAELVFPCMTSRDFRPTTRVKFRVGDLTAIPFALGHTENERVFHTSGTYELILGDDLQHDLGNSYRLPIAFSN